VGDFSLRKEFGVKSRAPTLLSQKLRDSDSDKFKMSRGRVEDDNRDEFDIEAVKEEKEETNPASKKPRKRSTDWDEEQKHYHRILNVFRNYRNFSREKIRGTEAFLKSFPQNHQKLLSEYSAHLDSLIPCFDVNQHVFDLITEQESIFENHSDMYCDELASEIKNGPGEHNHLSQEFDKTHVVLKQLVRDWSSEGQRERNLCYTPIIEELESRFSKVKLERDIRVLIPGAGLGRLSHEIVRRGYCAEGNEFSLFMLFASNFILNRCSGINLHTCYPWIHQNTNVLFHMDQIRPVLFPDINPSNLPPNAKFSMTAGDFLEVYEKPEHEGAWDCVVTCFFIDCAKNIVAFLERILYCLKENGVWINLGPLLYHYADTPDEKSIEPPYDFLAGIIRRIGFKIEKEILDLATTYADNPRSMLSFSYKSVFLVCTKLPVVDSSESYAEMNNCK